jgi:hypothetical protein
MVTFIICVFYHNKKIFRELKVRFLSLSPELGVFQKWGREGAGDEARPCVCYHLAPSLP